MLDSNQAREGHEFHSRHPPRSHPALAPEVSFGTVRLHSLRKIAASNQAREGHEFYSCYPPEVTRALAPEVSFGMARLSVVPNRVLEKQWMKHSPKKKGPRLKKFRTRAELAASL